MRVAIIRARESLLVGFDIQAAGVSRASNRVQGPAAVTLGGISGFSVKYMLIYIHLKTCSNY